MVIRISDVLTNESTRMNLTVIILITNSQKFTCGTLHGRRSVKFQNSGHVFRVGTAVNAEGSGVATGVFSFDS